MSDIIDGVAMALRRVNAHDPEEGMLPHDKFSEADIRRLACAALTELTFILRKTNNSSLNYTADELEAELRESA